MALQMRERNANRKQTGSNVSVPLTKVSVLAWPIYAGFTVHRLMIVCKYLSLNDKPDYQRSGFNTF